MFLKGCGALVEQTWAKRTCSSKCRGQRRVKTCIKQGQGRELRENPDSRSGMALLWVGGPERLTQTPPTSAGEISGGSKLSAAFLRRSVRATF